LSLKGEIVVVDGPPPVRALHGVGKVTEEHLAGAGLRTVGDLQDYAGDLRVLVGVGQKNALLTVR